ncbi:MAG: CIA30 family protein [Candidatus Hinthialibacter antarcticus]|nr:CIA30 family protein [Candidatus Hinthialibacter antarcticus]
MRTVETETVLFDFQHKEMINVFFITNDSVMGGKSQSRLSWNDQGRLTFTGDVSLENNGGFASFRSKNIDFELKGQNYLSASIIGDGKRYRLSIGTNERQSGVYYYFEFDTKTDQKETIVAPLKNFVAKYRGRTVGNAPMLKAENIASVGLMIADSQQGDFSVEIEWIKATFDANNENENQERKK